MTAHVRVLFVGEGWRGSSARSLRESLANISSIDLVSIDETEYFGNPSSIPDRIVARLKKQVSKLRLTRAIRYGLRASTTDVLLVYKGNHVDAQLVRHAKDAGVLAANVFPDYSPHVYGRSLRGALGEYDLVMSTKPFHPDLWQSIYGYSNRCVVVPHGYDPQIHLWTEPPIEPEYDVVMAATWRPEYDRLLLDLARALEGRTIRMGLAGLGWDQRMHRFPASWTFAGIPTGRAYGQWLRNGKMAIAPLNTEVVVDGIRQPGDQDTTRTYELAAAYCFFLHRRSPYAQTVYDEATEVPMWESAEDLAKLVVHYLDRPAERLRMAAAAHERAVPAYSIPNRAEQVMAHIRDALARRDGP